MMTTTREQSPAAQEARTIQEYGANPSAYRTISGVPDFIAPRTVNWVADGIDEAGLLDALRGLSAGQGPGTPAWIRHFSAIGAAQAAAGRAATADDDAARAKDTYLSAAFYYFLARFPHFVGADSGQAREAYLRHRDAYLHASRYFDPPLQVVRIPFEGAEIVGYLRVPAVAPGATQPPVVIVSGGIDYWKSESELHTISEALLRTGLATFAVDMPGTGESPILSGRGAERLYLAAIEHLKGRADVDGTRLGFFGLSFGGHWAVHLAMTSRDLRAAVNVSGPIHHAFEEQWYRTLQMGTLATLAATLGLNLAQVGLPGLGAALAPLSLVAQGVLAPGSHGAALLSIGGGRDESVPLADLTIISQQGLPQDTMIFAQDRHVASRNRALHLPLAARWLKERLKQSGT